MWPFQQHELVYRVQKGKAHWLAAKKALQTAGIKINSGQAEAESPICGCGSKLDPRNFGAGGKIDRTLYYIEALPEDAARAKALLQDQHLL